MERWRAVYALDPARQDAGVTLARLAYGAQGREVAGKAMDFSGASIRHRWDAGHRDAIALLDGIEEGRVPVGAGGLTVLDPVSR